MTITIIFIYIFFLLFYSFVYIFILFSSSSILLLLLSICTLYSLCCLEKCLFLTYNTHYNLTSKPAIRHKGNPFFLSSKKISRRLRTPNTEPCVPIYSIQMLLDDWSCVDDEMVTLDMQKTQCFHLAASFLVEQQHLWSFGTSWNEWILKQRYVDFGMKVK